MFVIIMWRTTSSLVVSSLISTNTLTFFWWALWLLCLSYKIFQGCLCEPIFWASLLRGFRIICRDSNYGKHLYGSSLHDVLTCKSKAGSTSCCVAITAASIWLIELQTVVIKVSHNVISSNRSNKSSSPASYITMMMQCWLLAFWSSQSSLVLRFLISSRSTAINLFVGLPFY